MDAPSAYDYNPNNLPKKLLEAIGLAMTSAAHTESLVNEAIASLSGLDFDYGGAITTHMNMALKLNVLFSLGELKFPDRDDLAEYDDIVVKIQDAFGKRNNLAHDMWAIDSSRGVAGQVHESARSNYSIRLEPLTVNEVEVIATEIYHVGMRLFKFLRDRQLVVPIPGTPRLCAHRSNAERKAYRKSLFS